MGVSYSKLCYIFFPKRPGGKKYLFDDSGLTSSSLLSGRGAVSDGGELRLDVHVVLLDVPGGQSWQQ